MIDYQYINELHKELFEKTALKICTNPSFLPIFVFVLRKC